MHDLSPFSQVKYDANRLGATCLKMHVRLLVAFGSRVTGTPPPADHSDLDLAILPAHDRERSFFEYYTELSAIFRHESLDLSFLNKADPLFRYEIMKNAMLLFGDIDDFLEYRAFAYKDFIDSEDLRTLEERLFQKKMASIRRQLSEPAGEKS